MDYIRIIDSDNNIYNYPNDFWLSDNGWKVTSKTKNIAFYAGGKDVADNFLQARNITVEGFIRADDLYSLEIIERGVQKATLKGGKLYVIGDVVNRYMEVKAPTVSSNYTNDYRTEKKYNINYMVEYPFWQNATLTEVISILDGSTGGEQFTVDNSESDFLVYPIITIAADQGNDLPYIKLTNLTDNGMFFIYEDPNFLSGNTLVIDCREGTVLLNGVDSFVYFTTPRFLRVQDAINTFFYEGSPCTITITFRKVFL